MIQNSAFVEAFREGSLIAFLGAGVSRSYTDASSGTQFPGLPMASDILESMRRTRPALLGGDVNFPQACFLLKQSEGRAMLEKFLLTEMDKPALKPLPAHTMCANLPFAAYITTNFDTLLERSLGDASRPFHVVISDDDVSRLTPGKTPLIKLHGCITRPSSIIAAHDEYDPIGTTRPIVEALLKAILANRSVIFLGFSLQDKDFELLFEEVHKMLGKRMPRSTAVFRNPSAFQTNYWHAAGVTIIDEISPTSCKTWSKRVLIVVQSPCSDSHFILTTIGLRMFTLRLLLFSSRCLRKHKLSMHFSSIFRRKLDHPID